ncbi:unnamed protein product [Strongylus vulgaris]|uniref:Uncharacterized protein n=1 Tax=Strongylus vulgaris TaxID=40348 RepID=A0A3P7LBU9_STRVU|nr:unnamed protein product [Strongylus vulgaris]
MYSLDERGSYRQQRKRRAGISGGSVLTKPRSTGRLANAGDSGCSSAGIATGHGLTLGGRSPQSSFDSNTDVAQISMNWMRMNGLGTGAVRPLLTGGNTTVAKVRSLSYSFSTSTWNCYYRGTKENWKLLSF